MKFEDLIYDGKNIKIVIDLDDVFIEKNDDNNYQDDECDTLDLTNITIDFKTSKGD